MHACRNNISIKFDYIVYQLSYSVGFFFIADLSKNRFIEIPSEIFEYRSAECLNCYHNAIKFVPEALLQLQNLTHLCLRFVKCFKSFWLFSSHFRKSVFIDQYIHVLVLKSSKRHVKFCLYVYMQNYQWLTCCSTY